MEKQPTTLRSITTSFDETVRVGGIGLALFFTLLELVYINAKSLYFLDGSDGFLSITFAIIGSLAYSSTTIAVMRRPGHRYMKIILPLFDTVLVFCGYNINLFSDVSEVYTNPMHILLSIFIAAFTGVITYGLGMLNFEERTTASEQSKTYPLPTVESNRNNEATIMLLNEAIFVAEEILPGHAKFESWNSKKKDASNRTEYETAMNEIANKIKQGEKPKLIDYLKITNN